MRSLPAAATALMACLFTLPALSAELPGDPRLAWGVSFGGAGSVGAPSLSLALDARGPRLAEGPATLARLDLSAARSALAVAGVALWQRDYRLNQNDGTDSTGTAASGSPHQWVWWTLGGLAATAALVASAGSAGSGNDASGCVGVCNSTPSGTDSSGPDVGSGTINGPGDTHFCVYRNVPDAPDACVDGLVDMAGAAEGAFLAAPASLDDRITGGMGDLVAR